MSILENFSQTNAINASTSSESASTAMTPKDKANIMGKEDFLTLLVAQLQNQDPLNPDDPTEFTAQLAQFSSLEQLFTLNDSMENLVTSNANSDRLSTLQTIGKHVAYQGSKFEYDGSESVQLGYQLDGPASEVQITIQKDGTTVATIDAEELTKGNHYITWDGMTASGTTAESGSYTIAISVKATEGTSVAASPLIKSEVIGVDLSGDFGGTLQTRAGEVSFNSILGVYEPEDTATTTTAAAATSNRLANTSSLYTKNFIKETATDEVALLADKYDIKDDRQISLNLK